MTFPPKKKGNFPPDDKKRSIDLKKAKKGPPIKAKKDDDEEDVNGFKPKSNPPPPSKNSGNTLDKKFVPTKPKSDKEDDPDLDKDDDDEVDVTSDAKKKGKQIELNPPIRTQYEAIAALPPHLRSDAIDRLVETQTAAMREALEVKAEEYGVDYDVILEVFRRGWFSGRGSDHLTEQEIGFNRVNSFLEGGLARRMDADLLTEDYASARKIHKTASDALDKASMGLNGFPKGPMGLTPDHIRTSKEFRDAKASYANARANLGRVNKWFLKDHGKEYKAELYANRLTKRDMKEDHCAGEDGTPELLANYTKDTPGQSLIKALRAKKENK